MSEPGSSGLPCPACQYDLRGLTVSEQWTIRCPECGFLLDLHRTRRFIPPQKGWSRTRWILTTYGAGFVLPFFCLAIALLSHNVLATTLISLSLLAGYSCLHSNATTPRSRHRWIDVMMRAVMHFFMSILLAAAVVAVGWLLIALSGQRIG